MQICQTVQKVLDRVGAHRVMVGHTVQVCTLSPQHHRPEMRLGWRYIAVSNSSRSAHRSSGTVQDNIRSRCEGKVLLMDVGMTRWIRGKNLAAFTCKDGDVRLVDIPVE